MPLSVDLPKLIAVDVTPVPVSEMFNGELGPLLGIWSVALSDVPPVGV